MRNHNIRSFTLTLVTLIASVVTPLAAAGAQRRPVAVSVSGGTLSYDMRGTGTVPIVSAQIYRPIGVDWLVVQGGLGFASVDEQFVDRRTQVGVASVELQLQSPRRSIRPYIGLGQDAIAYVRGAAGRSRWNYGVSASTGARFDLRDRFGVRADARLRYWNFGTNGFINAAGELTAGVTYRL